MSFVGVFLIDEESMIEMDCLVDHKLVCSQYGLI